MEQLRVDPETPKPQKNIKLPCHKHYNLQVLELGCKTKRQEWGTEEESAEKAGITRKICQ